MQPVTLATDERDVHAIAAIESHHAELSGALALRVDALRRAARRGDGAALTAARDDLHRWCRTELEPHANAEERTLYDAAEQLTATRLLVRAMSHEHGLLTSLIARIGTGSEPLDLVADAATLQGLLESHVAKENELLLPELAATSGVSLARLLEQMHDQVRAGEAAQPQAAPTRAAGSTCGCHDAADDGHPELDARTVPHAIRHATIFGALDGLSAGDGLVLVAPHDPLPLLAQIEQRSPDAFVVDYLERGPEAWRLLFVRR